MCADIYTATQVYQATYNTSDKRRREMRAAATKNIARTHAGCSSVHAGRHSTSDWHWCRANDILHPLPYELTGLNWQECWWGGKEGSIILLKGQEHMKKSCIIRYFYARSPNNAQNNKCTKILGNNRVSSNFNIIATIKQF